MNDPAIREVTCACIKLGLDTSKPWECDHCKGTGKEKIIDKSVVRWFEPYEYLSETLFVQTDGVLRLHIHPIAKDVIITREDIVELAKRKMEEAKDGE